MLNFAGLLVKAKWNSMPMGSLEVEVEGLLFAAGPKNGTIGDVTHVSASLTCEGDGLAEVDSRTTGRVPLSAAGDAEIEEELGSKGV